MDPVKLLFLHKTYLKSVGRHFFHFEAVNGVPVAVKHEAVAPVKGEPFVAVRVVLK